MTGSPGPSTFLLPVMSQMDVTFVQALGDELERRGNEVKYLPQDKRLTLRDSKKHIDEASLVLDHIESEPKRSFEELLEEYGIHSPRQMVFPQMVYDYQYTNVNHRPFLLGGDSIDYDPYFDLLHRVLDTIDGLYQDGTGPVPIQHQGAEVLRRVLQRVAEEHDVKPIWVGNSPIDGHCGIYNDEYVTWETFDDEYVVEMDESDRNDARHYVDQVRDTKPFTGKRIERGGLDPASLTDRASGRVRRLLSPDHDARAMIGDWLRARGRRVGRGIKGRLSQRYQLTEEQSERTIERTNCVFFPVQVFRESRVTVRSPPYYDLVWIVEYISRSLPHGYELVVKDHPDHIGALPLATTLKIAQFAEFLHPEYNAHRVIERADAVVTLNNTVGYEALIHGKPVVVLGSAFYDGAGHTIKPEDVYDIPSTLQKAIDSNGLDQEEILEFVHRVIDGSYPGEWGNQSRENVQRLTTSILANHDASGG